MGVHGVVAGRVGLGGQAALAGEAARHEAVVQLDGRRGEHRLREGGLDLDDRVGFLDAGREDASGAAEFDAGAGLDDAVGEEGGGEGVALVALVCGAVEGEGEGAARSIRPRVRWRKGWPAAEPLTDAAPPPPLPDPSLGAAPPEDPSSA